ncbi:MAG: 16S rRNA processing protein RimM, partial [Firmicutes bacterium]|nr:16S rRNA processing protein RimM [Candidatus Caballimonas caccae]
GLIVKPQGIKGEVKVEPLTSDISRFKNIKEVYIDDKPVKVLNSKISGDTVFLSLFGIADRNQSELLRNKYISVKRENAIELKSDSFFIADIIGVTIINSENEKVGKVVDITSLKTDIFTVLTESGKIMRFPFLKDLIVKVDLENSTIVLDKKRLSEVCVYED